MSHPDMGKSRLMFLLALAFFDIAEPLLKLAFPMALDVNINALLLNFLLTLALLTFLLALAFLDIAQLLLLAFPVALDVNMNAFPLNIFLTFLVFLLTNDACYSILRRFG